MLVAGKRVVLISREQYELLRVWVSPEEARRLIAEKKERVK